MSKRSVGALVGRSLLLGMPSGAMIGLIAGMVTMSSTILDPLIGTSLEGERWFDLVLWIATGGVTGAILGGGIGVVTGPIFVLLRLQRMVPAVAGVISLLAILFIRPLVFGMAWGHDGDTSRILGLAAAGLGAVVGLAIGLFAFKLLDPKAD